MLDIRNFEKGATPNAIARLNKMAEVSRQIKQVTSDDFVSVRQLPAQATSHGLNLNVLRQRLGRRGKTDIKIYEVQSNATGDGIYNCYEQTLDKTEWDDTAGDDRFDDKDATLVEVFNLLENHCQADCSRMLAFKDRIMAWSFTDDEGNSRLIGLPLVDSLRQAKTTAAPGSGDTIVCNLILNDGGEASSGQLGYNITVNCTICGGTALNLAIPRISNTSMEIPVYNRRGKWYCAWGFNVSCTSSASCV